MTVAVLRRRGPRPARRRETWAAFGFLSPWIIGFLVFMAGPMVASFVLSLTDYDVLTSTDFVGPENYRQLLADPKVRISLANTLIYTVLHVPLTMAVALGLAMLLVRVGRRSAGIFRTLFYLPTVTPKVAVGVLFLLLFNGQVGLINEVLGWVGIDGPDWTVDGPWIKPGLVLMSAWALGSTVIIYLAALQNAPRDLYEAAEMDGTRPARVFWRITLPLLIPNLLVVVVLALIRAVQIFDEVYVLTGGGPGTSTMFLTQYIYEIGFASLLKNPCLAAAASILMGAVLVVLTLLQLGLARRGERRDAR
jgi:multiple sugar transport system permease protein